MNDNEWLEYFKYESIYFLGQQIIRKRDKY